MVKQVHNQLLAVTICVAPLTCYLSSLLMLLLPSFLRQTILILFCIPIYFFLATEFDPLIWFFFLLYFCYVAEMVVAAEAMKLPSRG